MVQANDAHGFKMRGSDRWVFFQADKVATVRDLAPVNDQHYSRIEFVGNADDAEVMGSADEIASILWPLDG